MFYSCLVDTLAVDMECNNTLSNLNTKGFHQLSNRMEAGTALKDVLLKAHEDGRLTCGVLDSGKMLEMNPDGVMVCIMPENSSDEVALHIHCTLIEAFCWENDIRLLKVDDVKKIAKLFGSPSSTTEVLNDNDVAAGRVQIPSYEDLNCILVEYPLDECSEAEEDLLHFCKITCTDVPHPVIELDV